MAKMTPVFKEEQFTATPHSTAKQKADFANRMVKFIEHDRMDPALFTKALYDRLCQMFNHIAHYNRAGFADEWFSTSSTKVRFLRNLTHRTSGGGQREFTWSDVEEALTAWVLESGFIEEWAAEWAKKVEGDEKRTLCRLVNKYGVADVLCEWAGSLSRQVTPRGSVPSLNGPLGTHGVLYGTDEAGEEFATIGLCLPEGVFAEIEDGTYGSLQGLRVYLACGEGAKES